MEKARNGYFIKISGMVQGVWFRANACDVAKKLNITGWIKNANDGSVEAEIFGNTQQLEKFIKWLRQGPQGAQVKTVELQEIAWQEADNFAIKY